MTSLEIYFLTILDGIRTASILIISGSIFAFLGSLLVYAIEKEFLEKKYKKTKDNVIKASGIIFLLGSFINIFVPTTKEAAAIIFIPQVYNAIANNKEISKLPRNIAGLANQWIEELAPNNRKEK